jgi:hypothetical protein
MERAYDLKGTTTKTFTDVKKGYWAYNSIQMILANGITSGYTDGTFRPENPITRAEFSSMLDRYIN